MTPLDAKGARTMEGGYSFSLRDRLARALWICVWALLARWTPAPMHRWRCLLLRAFGASIGKGVRVYGSATVWHPVNLHMDDLSWLGPRVNCYNQARVTIGRRAVISQGAHICSGSHDTSDPHFQLITRPIVVESEAWIAADAFIGPGVRVGEGAVLGARGVAMRDLAPWTIYSGNPAAVVRKRVLREVGTRRELPQELAGGS